MITTINLSLVSGRFATCSAAQVAAPDEIPTSRPSSLAMRRAGRHGIVRLDADDLVIDLRVEHSRHKAGTDALDWVRPLLPARQHRRGIRLDGHHLERRLARLDHLAHAGDRAAGADAGNQVVDLAVGVAPDFLGRGAAVDLGVGRVLELLRQKVLLRVGSDDIFGTLDRPAHAFGTGREDQLGAVGAQQHAPLLAHGFGHDQDALVALGGADQGQGDAGVAAGRLDDDRVLVDQAGLLGGVDHGKADAVLDAGAGIEKLQLGHDRAVGAFGEAVEADKRGVADQFSDIRCDIHGMFPLRVSTFDCCLRQMVVRR